MLLCFPGLQVTGTGLCSEDWREQEPRSSQWRIPFKASEASCNIFLKDDKLLLVAFLEKKKKKTESFP